MEIYLQFTSILMVLTSQYLTNATGVVYYVKPTEPCLHNSSCPFNESCHTMDHYANNGSHYFSPDHINVTLYFMCGVHNCTKHVDIHDLESFAMVGIAGTQYVIINMPINIAKIPQNPKISGNATYVFTNVSNLRIENATIYFISLNFKGNNTCLLGAKHVNFYGYAGVMSSVVSVISINRSNATLKNCTFQNNCFITIYSRAILAVSNCTFRLYNHAVQSPIVVNSSTIVLSGIVSFIGNKVGVNAGQYHFSSFGGVILMLNIRGTSESSILNISAGAHISFINNSATGRGGALYLRQTLMSVNSNAKLIFIGNYAVPNNTFCVGGAMYLEQSNITVKTAALLLFVNNVGYQGGGIYLSESSFSINECKNVSFINNNAIVSGGAIYLQSNDISVDAHSSLVFHNNSARWGGAIYLPTPANVRVGSDSCIKFSHNNAQKYGGAIYVDDQKCFFDFRNYSSTVLFVENSAKDGLGIHIYGGSVKTCMSSLCNKDIVNYTPNISNSLSPVSSYPKRVCLCDTNGTPQCVEFSYIFFNLFKVYRGEFFDISVVVVGYDFGVTAGTVSAEFVPSKGYSKPSLYHGQSHQLVDSNCSNVTYSVYSKNIHETLNLYTSEVNNYNFYSGDAFSHVEQLIGGYNLTNQRCAPVELIELPVSINITLFDGCPPGFTLSFQDQLYGCYCYTVLQNNQFDCFITNNSGYLKWNSTMWVNATFNKYNESESIGIMLAQYCPPSYCRREEKQINLGTDPNAQCDFNHADVLCGSCESNYSLALGSSHCIQCSSDLSLLLVILFAIAGVFLMVFILLLNLTVTQGLINGLIFYANILWTYRDTLFLPKQQQIWLAFQIFIAWLNLDFGIETCFAVGLTAFWKTWLQFLFPLYIWLIAGIIIIACRYSSHLTNLIGDRAVPLLATLFLLSYTKLLRTLMTIFEFGVLIHYPNESKIVVWYIDGNLPYCQHPHIYLFIIAMIMLIVFCLPFTLFLLLIQCWKRISHLRLLRWINKFTPFYDAYFAPLKDRHHYWFGTLLLARGALLIVFTTTSSTSPLVGLLILAITLVLLLLYMSIMPVYKSKIVRLFESASLSNLLVLISYTLYTGETCSGTTALHISIGVAFFQFILIILISAIKICYQNKYNYMQRGYNLINQDSSEDDIIHERVNDPDINADMIYHPIRNTNYTY